MKMKHELENYLNWDFKVSNIYQFEILTFDLLKINIIVFYLL